MSALIWLGNVNGLPEILALFSA